jgi:Flp pilus assembly protein TadG
MRSSFVQVGGARRKQGQALAEFALVIPLLALVLFAIIQYGFIFGAYITLRNAAAVGARYAVVGNQKTIADIQTRTRNAVTPMLNVANVTAVNVNTNFSVGTLTGGATRVEVRYNLPLIIPYLVIGRTGNTLPMSAAVTMY